MAAADLTQTAVIASDARRERARILRVAASVCALTLLAAIAGSLDPSLGPGGTPHPTLHGTLSEALGLLAHNLRVLAAPVILALARWGRGRASRLAGDIVVAFLVAVNTTLVGLALGRLGTSLIAYLPQLPLEWSALTVSASAWLSARRGQASPRTLAAYTAGTLALATAAALLETFAVPHAH